MTDLALHYATARSDARGITPSEHQEAAYVVVDVAEEKGITVWDVLRASGLFPEEKASLARAWAGLGAEHQEFLP
jgi:hypothetical protein